MDMNGQLLFLHTKELAMGRAWWLTPVIPALWEAEAGGSLVLRNLRSAWETYIVRPSCLYKNFKN